MPINPIHFRRQDTPDWSGLGNLFQNFYKGRELAQTPQRLERERRMQELQEQILGAQAQYQPSLYEAQIAQALAKEKPAISNFGKLINEYQEMLKNDPNNQLLPFYKQKIQREAEGQLGTELTIGPNGEIMFTQGGSAAKGANQQFYVDENGNVINVSKPGQKATNVHQAQQRASAELEYAAPFIEQPYEGAGSNIALKNDLQEYKRTGNLEAKERLIQGAIAYMMVPDVALWQLQSLAAEATVPAIARQEKTVTTGWAESGPWFFNNLPKELIKEAKDRQKKLIKETKDVSAKQYAQGFPTSIGEKKEKVSKEKGQEYSKEDLEYTAKLHGLTVDEVKKRLEVK